MDDKAFLNQNALIKFANSIEIVLERNLKYKKFLQEIDGVRIEAKATCSNCVCLKKTLLFYYSHYNHAIA